jgi:Tol biopolymer transport system component
VTTTGLDIDSDGYRVVVNDSDQGAISVNDTLPARLDPGSRRIGLTGLAPNCTLDGPASRTVTIAAGEVVPIEFAVACAATTGVIEVLISGSSSGDLFQAMVDGATPVPVGRGAPGYVAGVSVGDHVISIIPPSNCSVETDPQSVTMTAGSLVRDTVEVAFSVSCARPTRPRIAFLRSPQPWPDGTPGPGTTDIYLANADGSDAARLTSGESPAWSPDGRRIAFYRDEAIHVIDADGSNERPLGKGNLPAWSPDGTRIVFVTTTGGFSGAGIFVMNADGSGLTRLISGDFANPGSREEVAWPKWSPDGRRISFVRVTEYDSFEPWAIYVINADGSDPRKLNHPGGIAEVHNWSPDGSRIALSITQEFWTIASVSSSGGGLRVHYRDEPGGTYPDWSPDGRRLVFNRYLTTSGCEIPSCPMRIFVVSTEGGPARQLIPEVEQAPDYWDHEPAWARVIE